MKSTATLLAVCLAVPVLPLMETGQAAAQSTAPVPDSVSSDLASGRSWHTVRRMRAAGAQDGLPEAVLLLARAEAGWENWDEVLDLLDDAAWLDEVGSGEGWYLLGRAYETQGRWVEADSAYASVPESGTVGLRAEVLRVRHARVKAGGGDHVGALALLDGFGPEHATLESWISLELAQVAAMAGDTAWVAPYTVRVADIGARAATWRLEADARLAARDTALALVAFQGLVDVTSGSRMGVAASEAGVLSQAVGDTVAARSFLLVAIDSAPPASAGRAAAALLVAGEDDLDLVQRLGGILDRAGDGGSALRAYDRAAGEDPSRLPDRVRLARARLMATVRGRQAAALDEFRTIRETTEDEGVAVRNLEIWTAMRRRQGRDDAVRTLQRWLLEEHSSSPAAAALRWQRGLQAEARGETAAALAEYADLIENNTGHVRASQARMRTGQIYLGQGRTEDAAAVFDGYLDGYPEGGRWEEASYWSAAAHLQLGDSARAADLLRRIRAESPLSYYAVVGAELAGEVFRVDFPEGEPARRPEWLLDGLQRVDALAEAGLEGGAQAEVKKLVARTGGDPPLMMGLAGELLLRGRTVAGINLGWELRRQGRAWDRRLLEIVYPFPYRDMVIREAEEWGVDPVTLAAIMRQESAFKADIISRAGAVGLMQVMPPTGAALARAHGPSGFQEASLKTPEVNLHLGAAFFVEMSARYDDDLPLTLVAYNAGPTRATRWRRYPEAADPLRFTERIPFDETRGYVKNVRRNMALYRALYGSE
jgi:soluble lytic murein transglycosylase